MKSYLITGGARSGKSRLALELAENAKRPYYIATGWAGDKEMADRIAKHQAERGDHWTTIETRIDIAEAIEKAAGNADFIIVDCLTLWVSNLLPDYETEIPERLDRAAAAIKNLSVPIVFVTNELGSGIVPGDPISRNFRDTCGRVNQYFGGTVDEVILAVCGCALKIKSSS